MSAALDSGATPHVARDGASDDGSDGEMVAVEAGRDAGSIAADAADGASLPDGSMAGATPRVEVEGAAICPTERDESCAFHTPRGLVIAGYGVTPIPESLTFPRALSVLARHPATFLEAIRENVTRFDVASKPPLSGKEELGLSHGPPGRFRHEVLPAEVTYDEGGGYTDCSFGSQPSGAEPIALGYNSLRTTSGELLIQSTAALMRPDGKVEPVESRNDPRPYDLRWADAGCAPCGPRGLRTVALELTMKGESTPLFKLLPGERKLLRIDGIDYTFRLNKATTHPDPAYCGTSGWAVYRSDLATGE